MDLETALNFLVTHNKDIPFDQLVEKSFPLADINDAVEFALSHKPIRVMIKP
jgi:Zn-dependent alcohol dehydrogenase